VHEHRDDPMPAQNVWKRESRKPRPLHRHQIL